MIFINKEYKLVATTQKDMDKVDALIAYIEYNNLSMLQSESKQLVIDCFNGILSRLITNYDDKLISFYVKEDNVSIHIGDKRLEAIHLEGLNDIDSHILQPKHDETSCNNL